MRQVERHGNAARHAIIAKESGAPLTPVRTVGRKIASSFWGKAWCDNLEVYSDYQNRIPRGRTYVRNGSVIDLRIGAGAVDALVSGSNIYTVRVEVERLAAARWRRLVAECTGQISSLLDLLHGRFSQGAMAILARADGGLFPSPREITFTCSCPDVASVCKHVAAALYGIGARFDQEPGLFFVLRQVDGEDLIAAAASAEGLASTAAPAVIGLAAEDLTSVFGIEIDDGGTTPLHRSRPRKPARFARRKRRPEDDGFGEVFGPGLEVTTPMLIGFGVPRTTFANWVTTGVLLRTGQRGVYLTTASTLDRYRQVQTRHGLRR